MCPAEQEANQGPALASRFGPSAPQLASGCLPALAASPASSGTPLLLHRYTLPGTAQHRPEPSSAALQRSAKGLQGKGHRRKRLSGHAARPEVRLSRRPGEHRAQQAPSAHATPRRAAAAAQCLPLPAGRPQALPARRETGRPRR